MWTIAGVPLWASEGLEETLMSEHGIEREDYRNWLLIYEEDRGTSMGLCRSPQEVLQENLILRHDFREFTAGKRGLGFKASSTAHTLQ